jgi:hypothetical protein
LAIVLSVLRFTESDYLPFGIFKLFFHDIYRISSFRSMSAVSSFVFSSVLVYQISVNISVMSYHASCESNNSKFISINFTCYFSSLQSQRRYALKQTNKKSAMIRSDAVIFKCDKLL